ncbi:ABC transporter ATP-binding protein [Roseomonas marmotae]|uniref:ABC transporter ATP-binding protein n=1 Tax=Roseomonas marmotae TaxID=2768161 RepID=A0ABS3KHT7_9PROT|nr:ABC transporter ATP-binding protein [Roseomonas marmotae]MBO1077033.1 ABC transporter ATP-binding protein [Roseomonas marmotae]QTI80953.1 ABC transporter ATP-binding protein [Roseomonas marmotae]
MASPLVELRDLSLALPGGADRALGVSGVSFRLEKGEILCLVGESGSGKSLCAQALMGLLPRSIRPAGGRVEFEGRDLLSLDAEGWRELRGRRIAMIFQEPMTALNPVMRVGEQIAEMFEAHGLLTPRARRERALELAREVGLPDPERLLRAYPHQLSGGQRQRVMIAMALALEPALLIADEPTTALDVTTQAQILRLIAQLQRRHGMGIVFITHDFGVVREIADRVVVLRKGVAVEQGPAAKVLEAPCHPYTRALLDAVPSLEPPPRPRRAEQRAGCVVTGLCKTYIARGGWLAPPRIVPAVQNVTFSIARGETLGLVGESGSGKSTVARLLTRLSEPDAGHVDIGGADFGTAHGRALREMRRRVQMVFQDPFASLNPRRKVGHSISDGLVAAGMPRAAALERARQLLERVGLEARVAGRYPHEFSGGQRQRIGIARALALEPEVLVADEPVSALDVSVQKQVLELLEELKQQLQLAVLFITHDLHVAAQVCDRIAVMQRGRIIEIGPAAELLKSPREAYTRQLLDAIPGRATHAAG